MMEITKYILNKMSSEGMMFKDERRSGENFASSKDPHHDAIRSVLKSTPKYIEEKIKLNTPFKKKEI